MSSETGRALNFPEAPASPQTRRARHRMTEMVEAARRFGLKDPVLFNGLRPQDGELTAIWQYDDGRIAVYLTEDSFDVDFVPKGPLDVFATGSAEAAAAYVAGVRAGSGRDSGGRDS